MPIDILILIDKIPKTKAGHFWFLKTFLKFQQIEICTFANKFENVEN